MTFIMRVVPLSNNSTKSIPLFMSRIPAGSASQDDSDASESLDFNKDILGNTESLVYGLVDGDSMTDAGIFPGSLLVIDREAEVQDGCIAVVVVDGKKTVKRIERRGARLRLISENTQYAPLDIAPGQRLEVFGVVQYSIRSHKLGNSHAVFRVW